MANTEMETSQSSNLHPHSYHIHLQTNGAQASECEEAELGIFFLGFIHSVNDLKCFTLRIEKILNNLFMLLFFVCFFLCIYFNIVTHCNVHSIQ